AKRRTAVSDPSHYWSKKLGARTSTIASMEVPAPYVPSNLPESHDNFVRSNRDLEPPESDCVQGEPRSVKMVDAECRDVRTLRPRIDPLCPQTPVSIAIRYEIDERSIGCPSRLVVPAGSRADWNPLGVRAGHPAMQGHYEQFGNGLGTVLERLHQNGAFVRREFRLIEFKSGLSQ